MAGRRSSSSSDMRRPIKVPGRLPRNKGQNCHSGSGFPGRFRRSDNGRRPVPTATGSGLLRSNVRVLIPILIARRKDDTRACNYITAPPTGDSRLAIKMLLLNLPRRLGVSSLPLFFRLPPKAGALSPSPSLVFLLRVLVYGGGLSVSLWRS